MVFIFIGSQLFQKNKGKALQRNSKSLDDYAKQNEKHAIQCKVRMTVPKNIKLYRSIGYRIFDEEVVLKPNGVT